MTELPQNFSNKANAEKSDIRIKSVEVAAILRTSAEISMDNATQKEIDNILKTSKIVAVIGMSKNPEKDAYTVPEFLMKNGYTIIPVNPTADEILGQKAYKKLSDVPGNVDIVDVFRPSEDIPNYVEDVLNKKPKVFWEQLGIHNREAEQKIEAAGIKVVYDHCMRAELKRTKS